MSRMPTLMTTITVFARALSRKPTISSAATASTRNAAGRLTTPPSPGGCGDRVGQREAERGVEQLVEVAAPADGHGGDRDAVLEDQVPADDPGDQLAHRRVGVRVGAARDRDGRGQLGVGERGERAGHAREHERQDDRRAGVPDRLAEDDEDAGADDRAEAERGQVEQADRALERLRPSPRSRRRARRPAWSRRRRACPGRCSCGPPQAGGWGDHEHGAARALDQARGHVAQHAPGDGTARGGADDDQVGLLLLGEHEDPAHDLARTGSRAVALTPRCGDPLRQPRAPPPPRPWRARSGARSRAPPARGRRS